MNYTEVKIITNHHQSELVGAAILPYCNGFIIDDPKDVEEFSKQKTSQWDYIDDALLGDPHRDVSITLYLEQTPQGDSALADIKEVLAQEKIQNGFVTTLSVNGVQSQDWENNWKQYYKPFTIGSRLLIRPSWESLANPQGRTVLTIDPASSFGTGSHATTRLCLNEIDGLDFIGKTVLDAGCGSGILMSAMLLLGAQRAYGCDIEENAVKTTAENILKNHVPKERFDVYQGDFLQDISLQNTLSSVKYDVICANIVADVLKNMCHTLLSWLNKGGVLLISGIIDTRFEEVRDFYIAAGATVEKFVLQEGWAMIKLTN